MSDAELLARYAAEASPEAFAAIVERHAGMVHGVCRRILGEDHAAADAAQAVFILLARKARGLPRDVVLAGWLFRAAEGVSRNLARMRARRRHHEQEAGMRHAADAPQPSPWAALVPLLDAAIAALPARERDAVTLRFLRGLGRAEAASELGCPPKTLDTRLASALERLRGRLGRDGVSLAHGALPTLLAEHACSTPPATLVPAIKGACASAATPAHAVAAGYASTVLWAKLKLVGVFALSVVALTCAIGAMVAAARPSPPRQAAQNPPPVAARAFVPASGKLTKISNGTEAIALLPKDTPFAWAQDGKGLYFTRLLRSPGVTTSAYAVHCYSVAEGKDRVIATSELLHHGPKRLLPPASG